VSLSGAPATFGQGRPTVAQAISQMMTPSTCCCREMISALKRVWIPDHALSLGSAPGLVQRLQITNSCAFVGRSKIFVLLPSRQPF